MSKTLPTGNRIMDLGWFRQGNIVYTDEALVLACLLHVRGATDRPQQHVDQIARMLDDPNVRGDDIAKRSSGR